LNLRTHSGELKEDDMTTKDIADALTPVERDGASMIDARSLHEWLGIGRRFPSWIAQILKDYGFSEGSDYV